MATVLIIDDDPDIRETVKLMLQDHTTITAGDGEEGLNICRLTLPDLVLVDIVMPRKEGIETIIDIRKHWPDLPIIAMSGGWREFHQDYLNNAVALSAPIECSPSRSKRPICGRLFPNSSNIRQSASNTTVPETKNRGNPG
jgi:CheY-like chemotaxis protein